MRQRNDRLRPTRRGARTAVALAVAVATVALASACDRSSPTEPRDREVLLGGLFSLTGNWSTLGRAGKAAMELAVEDVNAYLAGSAAGFHLAAVVEDTRLDPDSALAQARALRARGVQVLLGPQSSAEVVVVKPFVDASGMLLVSPSSTAGSLAIVGDNVFRFTPSDSLEGIAVSALMWADGTRAVIPVWRDDAGNAGLEKAVRARVTALGGTVLAGTKYGAAVLDFAPIVAALDAQVRQAVAQHGAAHVAVYLAAFDEVVPLFATASADSVLGTVRWYGSDGVALSGALLASPPAAAFAARVGYPNPLPGLEEGTRDYWTPLVARVRERAGVEPDAFALSVYDAVWVVARAHLAAGAALDIAALREAFTAAAATYFGATGWTVLNAAGDRKYGDFDFWAIRDSAGVPRWTRVAYYETRTGWLRR